MTIDQKYIDQFLNVTSKAALASYDVVGKKDKDELLKPKAFVVLNNNKNETNLEKELTAHVKKILTPFKYPRWYEFVSSLPKTATGKIQRYKLRIEK